MCAIEHPKSNCFGLAVYTAWLPYDRQQHKVRSESKHFLSPQQLNGVLIHGDYLWESMSQRCNASSNPSREYCECRDGTVHLPSRHVLCMPIHMVEYYTTLESLVPGDPKVSYIDIGEVHWFTFMKVSSIEKIILASFISKGRAGVQLAITRRRLQCCILVLLNKNSLWQASWR